MNLRYRKIPNYILLTLLAMLFILPILWLLFVSFESGVNSEVSLISKIQAIGDNYYGAWTRGGYAGAYVNTFIIGIGSVLLSDLIGLPMAFAMARYKIKGKSLLQQFLFFLRVLPEMVFLLPLFIIFRNIGLFDKIFGMIIAFQIITLPYLIILLRSYIANVPVDLENAARVDGCSEMMVLFRVTLPAIATGLAASNILCFIAIWTNLLFPLVLSYTDAQTVSIAIASFKGYGTFRWPMMAAAAILSTVPQLIVFGFINKYLVMGLTSGAVKE